MAATHQFQGQVEVASGAGNGSHSLSVRCGGGNYGSVHVTVSHGQSPGGTSGGSGVLTLQLGKTYAHSPGAADGDAVGQKFGIKTAACHSSLARTVVFPKHAGIYNADGSGYDSGAEFNKLGPIFSDGHGVYVSPELTPGPVSEHLACENQFGTVLSHFTLHLKLVRKILTHYRSKLSPAGAFQSLTPGSNGIDAGGLGSVRVRLRARLPGSQGAAHAELAGAQRRPRSPPRTITSASPTSRAGRRSLPSARSPRSVRPVITRRRSAAAAARSRRARSGSDRGRRGGRGGGA